VSDTRKRITIDPPSEMVILAARHLDGQYLYLRYRHGIGTVDAYDAPGPNGWTVPPDGAVARFEDDDEPPAIDIGLDEFLHRTGLQLAPDAVVMT
jgi:hypothetical protein